MPGKQREKFEGLVELQGEFNIRYLPSGKSLADARVKFVGAERDQPRWGSVTLWDVDGQGEWSVDNSDADLINCLHEAGEGALLFVEGSREDRRWTNAEGVVKVTPTLTAYKVKVMAIANSTWSKRPRNEHRAVAQQKLSEARNSVDPDKIPF